MDLVINQEAFEEAKRKLKHQSERIEDLENNLKDSFDQLKMDWDTPAGAEFFQKFEEDLLKNLKSHALVVEHMSENLNSALNKYEEVFKAADDLVRTKY